ncbi:MAG TPA: glycosyltransferase N-terminal domain-containing protein [Gemmatimonadaceae bacterium]|nr:glycosyltransferase N-terminal domain-containing protein [Gemmatimonadaceae bacterium]
MNALLRLGYGGAVQVARAAAALVPPGESKLLRALRGRRGIRARYAAWGRSGRDSSRDLLWMHAPSVGEGLQASPVLALLRAERPSLQLAYTYFSPSAEAFARRLPVDFADYLPFDSPGDARAAVRALRPRALVFSKLDVWPALSREARLAGVRLGLVSGTVREESARRAPLARSLLRDAYQQLDLVGAVDMADAERLVDLGVAPGAISVTGDTRYDQVWERASRADLTGALLSPLVSDRPTLVAGSTWPPDEIVLLAAWPSVRGRVPGARLIIAPHEPTAAHLLAVESWASGAGLALARLGAPDAGAADVVLVDRVGVLGDLYALADVAYVGGGFHDAGLHSVLEPAAFGAPVVIGARRHGSRDAAALLAVGGAASVGDAGGMVRQLTEWLGDEGARAAAGSSARAVVQGGLGAAARSAALVRRLLDGA